MCCTTASGGSGITRASRGNQRGARESGTGWIDTRGNVPATIHHLPIKYFSSLSLPLPLPPDPEHTHKKGSLSLFNSDAYNLSLTKREPIDPSVVSDTSLQKGRIVSRMEDRTDRLITAQPSFFFFFFSLHDDDGLCIVPLDRGDSSPSSV